MRHLATHAVLPHCVDPSSHVIDCSSMEHHDEVETLLCPRIAAIQRAECGTLANPNALSNLIGQIRVLRATHNTTRAVDFTTYYTQDVYTGLYMPGIVHDSLELSTLLVTLAGEQRVDPRSALRFVSTNSNNGWTACIIAAYLARTHASGFHGLAINDLKTEWATVRNVRILLEKLHLSWRAPEAFDAAADAALMSYHPHVRNSLTPTAFAKAATLMPVSWVGLPPPFDICFRMGMYHIHAVVHDVHMLGGWCRLLAYHGDAQRDASQIQEALAAAHHLAGGRLHRIRQVGRFVLVSSTHMREASREANISVPLPLSNAVPFQFVNKTPPAAPELYQPYCIQDMAGCNWHRGVD